MKKFMIPLVMLTIVLVSSCKNDKSEETSEIKHEDVIVSGTISDADGKTLAFQKLTPTALIPIDSITLTGEGNFEFKDASGQTEFYRLLLDGDAIFLIGSPNEKIIINSQVPFISRNYSVEGSKQSKLTQEMNAHLVESADSLQNLNKYYKEESAKAGVNTQVLFNEVNTLAGNIFTTDKAYLTELIQKNEESLFIYLALYQSLGRSTIFTYPEDKEMFNFVLSKLEMHHPNNAFTASLRSDINKMDMAQQQNTPSQGFTIGDIAPDILMENPNGEMISLHSLRGQYVLLDFWASWCRPCRMENPNIVEEYNKYNKDGFTIFQVSLDKTHEDWVKGISDDNLTAWSHVSDLNYWNNAAARQYGVQSIPSSYLLDPEGKIIGINLRGPALGAKLKEIFGH